ncbi:3467_t:CDS:2, partial [Cetraspora pellucida]
PVQNLYNYVSLYLLDACEYFYLQLTRNAQEINNKNWFSKDKLEKNTLDNMMKEIAYASNLNVNEHKMMQFLGHHSTNELHTHKNSNDQQQLKNSILLLNAIQESQIVLQESQIIYQEFQVMQQESQVIQQESP